MEKILNKEDIESFGFKLKSEDEFESIFLYNKELSINDKIHILPYIISAWFLNTGITPRLIIHKQLFKGKNGKVVLFSGKVENKEDFAKLLTQIIN